MTHAWRSLSHENGEAEYRSVPNTPGCKAEFLPSAFRYRRALGTCGVRPRRLFHRRAGGAQRENKTRGRRRRMPRRRCERRRKHHRMPLAAMSILGQLAEKKEPVAIEAGKWHRWELRTYTLPRLPKTSRTEGIGRRRRGEALTNRVSAAGVTWVTATASIFLACREYGKPSQDGSFGQTMAAPAVFVR